MNDEVRKFIEKNRFELAKAYLARSDHSANILRTILFTASTAAIGFVLQSQAGKPFNAHLGPLILFFLAAAAVFWSWDLQKGKALKRFEALQKSADAYLKLKTIPNYWIDRASAGLLAAGTILEATIRACQAS